ncbi:hypothetical protein LCGC14_2687120, partial [marine sediment metagenome]
MKLEDIPDKELDNDLIDSLKDIKDCTRALAFGITHCNSGLVLERLNRNKQFVKTITSEIKRRRRIA